MDIYPPAAQRQALLKLMPALGCSDTVLRRDECGDPRIAGKHGVYGGLTSQRAGTRQDGNSSDRNSKAAPTAASFVRRRPAPRPCVPDC
jgi:hypothetical protein